MKWIAAALLVILLLLLPSFAGDFYVNLASQILIAAIFALKKIDPEAATKAGLK